jgi:hypothetical protein
MPARAGESVMAGWTDRQHPDVDLVTPLPDRSRATFGKVTWPGSLPTTAGCVDPDPRWPAWTLAWCRSEPYVRRSYRSDWDPQIFVYNLLNSAPHRNNCAE